MASPPQKLPGRMMKIQKEQKKLALLLLHNSSAKSFSIESMARQKGGFLTKHLANYGLLYRPHKSVQCTLPGNVMSTRKQDLSAQLGMQQPWEKRMRNILIMILPYLFYHHHPRGHRNFSSNRYSRSLLFRLFFQMLQCSCCFLISSDSLVVPLN